MLCWGMGAAMGSIYGGDGETPGAIILASDDQRKVTCTCSSQPTRSFVQEGLVEDVSHGLYKAVGRGSNGETIASPATTMRRRWCVQCASTCQK